MLSQRVCLLLSHNLLDSKINTVLTMCQDTNLLNPVHGIVQSVVYHEESPPQYQSSYLQSNYGSSFGARSGCNGPFTVLTALRFSLGFRFRLQRALEVRRTLFQGTNCSFCVSVRGAGAGNGFGGR